MDDERKKNCVIPYHDTESSPNATQKNALKRASNAVRRIIRAGVGHRVARPVLIHKRLIEDEK